MTVLLWILLILAAAALAAVASPIRFGAAGAFGTSRRAEGKFWVSYVHPTLFYYEYSSTGRKEERTVIFGIDSKWFKRKKRRRKSVDNPDTTDDINNANIPVDSPDSISDININTENNANTNNSADIGNNSIDNSDSTSNINNGDTTVDSHDGIDDVNSNANGNGETLMARVMRRVGNIKNGPIYTKTAGRLSGIGSGGFYMYLKDKTFRKKLFKWLKRVLRRAVTTVRLDKLKLRAAAGFADPANAGKMYGYFIAAKNALARRSKTINMELEPVFTEERLEADIEFAGRTSLAVIASGILTAALTFPYWRAYRLARKRRK